jgi:xylulokinase
MLRIDYAKPDLAKDYSGIIDSTLAAVYWYSRHFSRAADPAGSRGVGASNEDTGSKDSTAGESPLYVTGGATGSAQIMRRVSALWRRPVVAIGRIGAALGAAVAGVSALRRAGGAPEKLDELIESLLPHSKPLLPSRDDEAAYHRDGGYLARFAAAYDQYRR